MIDASRSRRATRRMAVESEGSPEEVTLKYLLVAEGALRRARQALREAPPAGEVAVLIGAAAERVQRAEALLWPSCDPWSLVPEGVW
jgi:hypothetical protein